MIVLKIGGSLYGSEYLLDWLNRLAAVQDQKIIIVPGGGPFADQVRVADRKWKFSAEGSHAMAVMAMQQFGRMLCDLNNSLKLFSSLDELKSYDKDSMVWAPYPMVINDCPYPKDWQTTSDSLSAWLATELSSDHLCLIKSGHVYTETNKNIESSLVDDYFSTALSNFKGQCYFYHASEASLFCQHISDDRFE